MKLFLKLFFIYLVTCFINVNAADVDDKYASDKSFSNYITVNSDEIYITEEGMFVKINREFLPITAIFAEGINEYKCDIHDRLHDLITCRYCGFVYDRYQSRICPNKYCLSNGTGPKA
jgi:hypothetical protein